MANEVCTSPGCEQNAVVWTYPVWKRRVRYPGMYCEEHAQVFRANYCAQQLSGEGPPQCWGEAVGFDIELVIVDSRPDKACSFSLREVGGSRRLDCQIGIFEAAALQRELEGLSYPRPLTHHAMASTITALGSQLEHVVIDKFFPAQEVNYEAKLHIQQRDETILVDVRPSDAIVLAVICDVPIVVLNSVLEGLVDGKFGGQKFGGNQK